MGILQATGSVLVSDLVSRTPFGLAIMRSIGNSLGRTWGGYGPEANSVLQSRFAMAYPPVLALFVLAVPAAILGAPWARNPSLWIVTVVYVLVSLFSDFTIVALHRRWYPVGGESFLASLRRLNEFGEQWPTFQKLQASGKTGRFSEFKEMELAQLGGPPATLGYVSDEW